MLAERAGWSFVAPLLMVAAFAVYSNVFGHAFLLNWDDLDYVVANSAIRDLDSEHVHQMFAGTFVGNWAPLHILSYAIDFSLWGLRPSGFLFTNVLLHGINGSLLYAFFRQLQFSVRAATLAAAVFVVHPIQVESVAWISERKNVLAMTFFLLALIAYETYRSQRAAGIAYVTSLSASAAALMTKSIAVVLAPILLLLDHCYGPPAGRGRRIADKLPFLLAAALIALVTMTTQSMAIKQGRDMYGMNAATTFYTMVPVIVRYLALMAWPTRLSAVYAPTVRTSPDASFSACLALVLVLVAIGAFSYLRDRRTFFWYATLFIALVPVLHIVPLPTLMNDRYLYFPMLGACGCVARAWERVEHASRTPARIALGIAATTIVLLLGGLSHARADVWRDDVALWRDAAAKCPDSPLAWNGVGRSLLDAGRSDEALPALLAALSLDPDYGLALNNMGILYNLRGEPERGRPYLVHAIQRRPDFDAYMNLGYGYSVAGAYPEAEAAFVSALRVRPESPDAISAIQEMRHRASLRMTNIRP
jgi:Tfp pilus assembly protein PilF